MNSRRLMRAPSERDIVPAQTGILEGGNVRFGSIADIRAFEDHARPLVRNAAARGKMIPISVNSLPC